MSVKVCQDVRYRLGSSEFLGRFCQEAEDADHARWQLKDFYNDWQRLTEGRTKSTVATMIDEKVLSPFDAFMFEHPFIETAMYMGVMMAPVALIMAGIVLL